MEEYRNYNENYEVSNLGNVKKNGVLVKPTLGEYYYCVFINNKPERIQVMVGKCFPEICGEWHKHYHYHHINRNQLDNRAENIVCLSPREHKRLHQVEDGVSVGVKAYNKNGDYVGQWESKKQAAEATGIDYRHITDIILGKTGRYTAGGYYWFRKDDGLTEDEIKQKIIELKNEKKSHYKGKSKRVIS